MLNILFWEYEEINSCVASHRDLQTGFWLDLCGGTTTVIIRSENTRDGWKLQNSKTKIVWWTTISSINSFVVSTNRWFVLIDIFCVFSHTTYTTSLVYLSNNGPFCRYVEVVILLCSVFVRTFFWKWPILFSFPMVWRRWEDDLLFFNHSRTFIIRNSRRRLGRSFSEIWQHHSLRCENGYGLNC